MSGERLAAVPAPRSGGTKCPLRGFSKGNASGPRTFTVTGPEDFRFKGRHCDSSCVLGQPSGCPRLELLGVCGRGGRGKTTAGHLGLVLSASRLCSCGGHLPGGSSSFPGSLSRVRGRGRNAGRRRRLMSTDGARLPSLPSGHLSRQLSLPGT